MTKSSDQLKNRLAELRDDLKYYQQMTEEEYINDRVLFKIKLYYLFSKTNKGWYNVIAIVSIILGILVPLSLALNIKYSRELATTLSLLTGGLISLEGVVFNFKEKFKSYKKTEDQLTNELMLFQTNSEPYNSAISSNDNIIAFRLFVSRVESIILRERDETIEKMTRLSLEQSRLQVYKK